MISISDLPSINASLNGISALFLVAGYVFIRRKKKDAHKFCMITASLVSILFLVCYVIYHNAVGFTRYTGEGLIRDGQRPNGWHLKRDPYLLETNVPGIFAAGDVRQGTSRRVAAAVGEGSIAIDFVHRYLKTV